MSDRGHLMRPRSFWDCSTKECLDDICYGHYAIGRYANLIFFFLQWVIPINMAEQTCEV
jgi:hypothetical protein